jgi:hypothetical protein
VTARRVVSSVAARLLPFPAEVPRIADPANRKSNVRAPLWQSWVQADGALIRRGAYAWKDAAAALQEAELEELDTSWLPDPEHRSVAVVLKLSIDALSEAVRACFFDCAVFREDVDVPEAALLQLWSGNGLTERRRKLFAQELVDRSLMRRDEQRRYRIHDLYMDYLHHAAAPLADRHRNLIERYRIACPDGWATCPDDGYCLQHIPWHLLEANKKAELHSLLFDPVWLRRKLKALGVNALIGDYRLVSEYREAGLLASAITMSAHVLGPNPDHLEAQLLGRLAEQDGPTVAHLLGALRQTYPSLFIPIRDGYLQSPGPLLRTIPTDAEVSSLAVLADGRRALSGSEDGTLRLWDLESGVELRRFEMPHSHWVAILADGRRALSGSEDGMLRLWDLDLESGVELRRFEMPLSPWVNSLAVFADGRRALTGSYDRTLRLWDLGSGVELRRFEMPHSGWVNSLAVFADGRRALSGSSDGMLRLWDLESGAELRRFEGHSGSVRSLAVFADGRWALSGSEDRTLRLWDLESGVELACFIGDDSVGVVGVSPTANRAILGDARGRVLTLALPA